MQWNSVVMRSPVTTVIVVWLYLFSYRVQLITAGKPCRQIQPGCKQALPLMVLGNNVSFVLQNSYCKAWIPGYRCLKWKPGISTEINPCVFTEHWGTGAFLYNCQGFLSDVATLSYICTGHQAQILFEGNVASWSWLHEQVKTQLLKIIIDTL